jgi:hypothetical protein
LIPNISTVCALICIYLSVDGINVNNVCQQVLEEASCIIGEATKCSVVGLSIIGKVLQSI